MFDKNPEGARKIAGEIKGFASGVDITDYKGVAEAIAQFEKAGRPDRRAGEQRGLGPVRALRRHHARALGQDHRHQPAWPAEHEPRRAARAWSSRGSGSIVNIASDAGRVGSSLEAVYSACKGGIIAFTKTVAREVARKGITLNTVCPGPTDTPLLAAVAGADERGQKIRAALVSAIPMKRVGQPDDIPGAVFLASEDASFITGQTISVSGGLTMHG